MKKILTIVLLLVATKGNSQTVRFDSLYDFNLSHRNDGAIALIVESTSYLVGGLARDSISNRLHLALLKLDFNGNTLYRKSYGSPIADYYMGLVGSLVKTYDGGYMMGGGVSLTTGISMLMKVDANGDSLWSKFYGDTVSWETIYQIKQTNDSGFICVGAYNPTGTALLDVLVIKTDSIGNVQWRKTIGLTNFYEQAFSVQQTLAGGYVVGGNKTDVNGNVDAYLIKLDSIGNLKWQRTYGSSEDDCPAYVELLPDSNYIITTCYTRTQFLPYFNTVFRFIEVDTGGNTVWLRDYGDSLDFAGPFTIVKTIDGNYIAAGQGHPTSTFGPNAQVLGRIFKINPQGDSLWYRSYYPSTQNCNGLCNQNYLRDIKPTPDGGYIACGWVSDSFQDMWVIKVDSMGCVDTLCIVPTAVGSLEVGSRDVKIYPNPANSNITVSAPLFINAVLTVNDLEGRVLLQREFNKEIEINVSNLKQGMYVITLKSEKAIKAVKFVKE